jgi:hypothetical protein
MGDVTVMTTVSLHGDRGRTTVIWHTENIDASNNLLVSAPRLAQFLRRYMRGYDRDHRDHL